MSLTYTRFTIPTIADYPYTPSICTIYTPPQNPSIPYLYIAYNYTSSAWVAQAGSTPIIAVDPDDLLMIPALVHPAILTLGVARLIDVGTVTLQVRTQTPTGYTQHILFHVTLPPQPPPPPLAKPFPYSRLHRYRPPLRRAPGRNINYKK